jgi:hypothetical protein
MESLPSFVSGIVRDHAKSKNNCTYLQFSSCGLFLPAQENKQLETEGACKKKKNIYVHIKGTKQDKTFLCHGDTFLGCVVKNRSRHEWQPSLVICF